MNKLTVYRQMTGNPTDLFCVLKQEIGLKTACAPFAARAITALKSLGGLSEGDAFNAANVFLGNLQTLNQGGIIPEDYDKIDFIKRGKVITVSARVEAFLRAAGRKGYRITDTIVPVPAEDSDTTYFEEQFYNGEIVYVLKDKRLQCDRKVTAERLVSGYFSKFICRLEVTEAESGKRVVMTNCEMSNDEILNVAAVSEQGLYKSAWRDKVSPDGKTVKKADGSAVREKVMTEELNSGTFWVMWTGEMVNKTIIRRALKRIREVLPDRLKDTIYAFDSDTEEAVPQAREIPFEIPVEAADVDLENLTEQQKADVKETLELFKANPKLAVDKANEIKELLENGASLRSVINTHFASLIIIEMNKKLYPVIAPFFESAPPAANDGLYCSICGGEITSERSKRYYAEHPNYTVKCYDCNRGDKK